MIWEMVAGAGCASVGYFIGHFNGYLMGQKIRNVTELFTSGTDDGLLIC